MATEIKLQKLGENLDGGKVLDVKVELGAIVVQGQPLVEVEAEKAAVEVLAPEAGQVTQVLVKKDDQVLFTSYAGTEVKINGEEYMIMDETDILGIVD